MTTFSDEQLKFLEDIRGAAMITLRADGMPHAVRIGVALVDGSGTGVGSVKA